MKNKFQFVLLLILITPVLASTEVGSNWFEKLIGILVSSALIFSVIKGYLTVNKIWKRKKNEEVANSIGRLPREI